MKILPLLPLLLSGLCVYAQSELPPAVSEPSAESQPAAPLQEDSALHKGQLSNGMRYVIRPTKEPAGQACLRLCVEVGALDEAPETSGLSHFIEHMVFNGSRHFRRGELIPAMQKLGIGFGGDANAYTGMQQTVYMLDLPNLHAETVDFALTALRDFADGATLADEDIERERGIIVSELHAQDSASRRAEQAVMEKLVGGTRVIDFQPIGAEDVILHCPAELIRTYYREHYVPSRMTLVVTGDVEPETAVQWVEAHFASMQACSAPEHPAVGSPSDMGQGFFIVPGAESADCSLTLAVVNPWKHRPDTLEQRVEDLPLDLACDMLNRRLARAARQEGCPFISAALAPRETAFGAAEIFSLSIAARPEQWQEALAAAVVQLRSAVQYGFTESEMEESLAALSARLRKGMDTWGTVAAKTVANGLVSSLCDQTLFTTPAEDARACAVGIARVQARPDLCREALAAVYDAARARLILSGRVEEGMTPERLSAAYADASRCELTPPQEEQLEPFAYTRVGEPGKVVEEQLHADLGITTLRLSNGVRANLKPMGMGMGRIYVSAALDGGILRLPQVPALPEMVKAVMSKGGLEAHSSEDMARLFAGHNVQCSFGMDEERFAFSAITSPRDLELQCQLLCAAILHPGFRPEGERQLRHRIPSFLRGMETTPEGAFGSQAPRSFFGNDPRFSIPTAEQFAAVNTAMVKEAISPFLQKGALELTFVGDFRMEDVKPVLERTFGAMPPRDSEFSPLPEGARHVAFQPWGRREVLPYTTPLDKTIVAQVRPAGDGRDLRRNRRLTILRNIVGGRLYGSIRAELGESYSPVVQVDLRQGYENAATITALSVGVSANVEKVAAAMDAVFASIGRGEIMEEEFRQALTPYLADADMAYRLPTYWVGGMVRLQSEPEAMDLLRDFRKDAASITLEEIRALAKEIFGHDKVNLYLTLPDGAGGSVALPPASSAPQKGAEAAAPSGETYAIVCSAAVWKDAAWRSVVEQLAGKHGKGGQFDSVRCVVLNGSPKEADAAFIADFLRMTGARHAAFVLRPEELGREAVAVLHRATRRVDDDPYGDCMWGIITGATPQDALRVAMAEKTLTIKRLLGTTNVNSAPFEHSCCITDWTNAPVLEQSGYTKPSTREFPAEAGRERLFAEQLETQRPQLLVTSSHATQFNLEMPFGKGLVFPAKGRFHLLTAAQMRGFGQPLGTAMAGNTQGLEALAEGAQAPAIAPDGEPRVWLAAGNCLIGNAQYSAGSMVVTALSAYTCNQMVGYTVPSWYGKGGWGTLSLFFDNAEGTSLAEAWYLNNQFILHETLNVSPELLNCEFNDDELSSAFFRQMAPVLQQLGLSSAQAQNALGLVHDRDVVAFYGDPAWRACIDNSHSPRPLRVEWTGEKAFVISANGDFKGRCAVWFPRASTGRGATECDVPGAVFTNDFILFPQLEMKKGETRSVNIR